MYFHKLACLLVGSLFAPGALANPIAEKAAPLYKIREANAARPNLAEYIYPRQITPTAYTTQRTANTQFAPPTTVTPADPSATGTQTTTHDANTEIIPSANTASEPNLITTDSRSANTQAVGPSTVSSALAVPTAALRVEVVLGIVAVGMAGFA